MIQVQYNLRYDIRMSGVRRQQAHGIHFGWSGENNERQISRLATGTMCVLPTCPYEVPIQILTVRYSGLDRLPNTNIAFINYFDLRQTREILRLMFEKSTTTCHARAPVRFEVSPLLLLRCCTDTVSTNWISTIPVGMHRAERAWAEDWMFDMSPNPQGKCYISAVVLLITHFVRKMM